MLDREPIVSTRLPSTEARGYRPTNAEHRAATRTACIKDESPSRSMKRYQILALLALVHIICADKIDPPLPCKSTSDCKNITGLPENTFCMDGYCICPGLNGENKNCSSQQTVLNSTKHTTPLVSRFCKHDQDCMLKNGFCNTSLSQCDCHKGYVASTNRQQCLKIAESIGSNCTDDKQCWTFQANTTCKNETCACDTGFHNVANACWRMAGFGKPCTKTQECSHIVNAVCKDTKVCDCPDDEVISKNETQCLSVAKKIQDPCTEDVQCTPKFADTVCMKEKCQCRKKYHFEEELEKCIVNKALDESCENNYECYQPENENDTTRSKALYCLANTCVCAEPYNRAGDICVNGSRYLESSIGIILLTTFGALLSSW